MNAGELRHRITFQKRQVNPATGGLSGWEDYVTVWGKVEDISGKDYLQTRVLSEGSLVTTEVTVRWRPDVTPDMRVKTGNRLLRVEAVLDDGRKRYLRLMCSEVR